MHLLSLLTRPSPSAEGCAVACEAVYSAVVMMQFPALAHLRADVMMPCSAAIVVLSVIVVCRDEWYIGRRGIID